MSRRLLIIDPAPPARDYLLDRLRSRGHHLTGVTPVVGSSGLELCHEQIVESFYPLESLIQKLRNLPDFEGVICYHQAAIHVANQIAHALGLTPSWENPKNDLASKHVIDGLWEQAHLFRPKRYAEDKIERYPVIVKPAGLQGQIGVRRCRTADEVAGWLKEISSITVPFERAGRSYEMMSMYRSDRNVIIQEFHFPDKGTPYELSAEFFVQDGEITLLGGFDMDVVEDEEFLDQAKAIFPGLFDRSPFAESLKSYVRAVGMLNGFCHLEFKICDGRVLPIELNARLVGEPLPGYLENSLGIDVADLLFALATGERIRPPITSDQLEASSWGGFLRVYQPRKDYGDLACRVEVPQIEGARVRFKQQLEPGQPIERWETCMGDYLGMVYYETERREVAEVLFNELPRLIRFCP